MSESVASLRHKISSAEELESVVRTMKAMAASSISQYENAVRSLDDYYRTVQLGLAACFRENRSPGVIPPLKKHQQIPIAAIVFGSDQGLVGQFNEIMVEYAVDALQKQPGKKTVWAVGARIHSRLTDIGLQPLGGFALPGSINAIAPLIGDILIELEARREQGLIEQVYLFNHHPVSGAVYTPVSQQLLPLDQSWLLHLSEIPWPTQNLPEVIGRREQTLSALVREYLFVTLFRACAESLASENASRLAAMQRAEKNIDELQNDLNRSYHRLRQNGIDEELFDVFSGFEALKNEAGL
ncbi:F0F1 ATP synthase subunit gamma [uncultured Amphritea sp.]|uniref:F0F1 ATP synthase subunit gamma n=1 Tax=uncultured Amphritea sp. TaxID=981605 RepID=UPI001E03EB7B|nr:F0F1 ATP synthase subunit gamma [uncultured Amphritea sp.]MBR9866674.1 F0F1 ATP synthase subunit gamma [Oceanospirillales bacterium]MBR9888789.1 F0F1 ATP synthase subunit gamma [Oceanospirillales bacterium]